MQQEIMANGPINVGMVVYEDLMYYAGGVYQVWWQFQMNSF
jgi:hypothetical protein